METGLASDPRGLRLSASTWGGGGDENPRYTHVFRRRQLAGKTPLAARSRLPSRPGQETTLIRFWKTLPVNGNEPYDDAEEPPQTVFSWAEFMAEEPVTSKGRGRKAQAATLLMFEWAFSLEREREAEPVGAGHVHRLSFVCRSDYFSEGASTGQSDIGGRTELDYAYRLACGSKSFNHLTGNCGLAKAGSDVSHPVTGNKGPFGFAL